jgi:multiple sugar transport system substrate-binding protein
MFEGHHYGLPWSLDSRQLLYRTDYFEQAGITKVPETWAEFIDACAKLKAALPSDVIPFVFPGGGDYNGVQTLLTFFVQNDVGYADASGQPDYLNPKVTEVLRFFHELYVNGYVPEGIGSYKATDADKLYQAGKAAIYHAGALDLKDFPELDANSRVMPPMKGPSGKVAQNYTWVNAIQGFGKTKDGPACLAFIKWMIENELELWTKGLITGIPARTSFRNDPYFTSAWQKKQIVDLILPNAVPPVWPTAFLYLPWSAMEGEAVPQNGMVAVFTRNNPDYAAIQQTVQNDMLRIWAEFE